MDLDVGFSRAVDDFYDGTVAGSLRRYDVDRRSYGVRTGPVCNLHHQLNEYHRLADDKAVIDYGFHGTVQHVNDEILDELESMVEDGVPSVKVYLTYGFKINDDGVLEVLKADERTEWYHGISL